eukprot:XP_001707288.1 Hypothetical protein GL50803_37338 [Giardia lamblia ATCC 50803]
MQCNKSKICHRLLTQRTCADQNFERFYECYAQPCVEVSR